MSHDENPAALRAVDIGQSYYEHFEWSRCDGTRWEALPREAQLIWVRMADHWAQAALLAGYSVMNRKTLQEDLTAALQNRVGEALREMMP